MNTVALLSQLVEHHELIVYFFIFLGLIIEGEFVLISIGILLHLGAMDLAVTLPVIIAGVVSKTLLGYYLGAFLNKTWKHTRMLKYLEKRVMSVLPSFKKKPFWSIFASKFILGVNNVVIIFSGYQRINFNKYLKAEFLSTLVWAPLMLFVGSFFSYAALNFSHEIWRFSLIVLVLVLVFITLDKFIGWIYEVFEDIYYEHE